MVYTGVFIGDKSNLFVTEKEGDQKVYYGGKNYFGALNPSDSIFDLIEISDFYEKYGYILTIKNIKDTFVFVTDIGVYLCDPHTEEFSKNMIEIIGFYDLYGEIINMNMNSSIIIFHTTKGLFYYNYTNVNIIKVNNFINTYGSPEIINITENEIMFKTSSCLIIINVNDILDIDKYEFLLDKKQLSHFEEKIGKIINFVRCPREYSKYLNVTDQRKFLFFLITQNGMFDYEDLTLYHNESLKFCSYYQNFIFYSDLELYTLNDPIWVANLNFVKKYGYIVTTSISENYIFVVTLNGVFYYQVNRDGPYINRGYIPAPKVFTEIPNFFQEYGNICSNNVENIKSATSNLNT